MNQCLYGLRGLLTLWVIAFYLASNGFLYVPMLNPVFLLGWLGIHLAFMLIAYSLTNRWMQVKTKDKTYIKYMTHRLARLYPSYFVSFLLLWFLFSLFDLETFSGFGDILGHFLLMFDVPPFYASPMNAVWSILSVLMLFYLVFPTLISVLKHLGAVRFLLVGFAVMLLYRYVVLYLWQPETLHMGNVNQLPGILGYVAVGMVLAYVQNKDHHLNVAWLWLFGILSALWFLITFMNVVPWFGVGALFFDPLFAITCGLLVHFVSGRHWPVVTSTLNRCLSGKWIQRVSDLSYGLLLWHLVVFKVLSVFLSGWLLFLVAGATVVLLAWMNYQFIERRFM